MKKILTYLFTLTAFILIPLTSTKALTKVTFNEVSNGSLETNIRFDEGFVGGLDISIQLSDNVEVKNFVFNNSLENCVKEYDFNKDTHTLNIKVAAGGVGVSHNLLNKDKDLTLGTINLVVGYKESVEYKVSISAITIVGNDWNSNTLANTDFTIDSKDTFNFLVNSSNNNSSNNNSVDKDKQDEDKVDTDKENNNDNTTSDNKDKDTSKKPTTNTQTNDKETDDKKEDTTDNNDSTVDNQNNSNNNAEDLMPVEDDEKDDSNISKVVIISILGVAIVGCASVLIYKKVKSSKNTN